MITNMKTLRYSLLACFLAGALLVTGCDSNDDDGDNGGGGGNLGTASVQITGEGIDEEFDGISFFFAGEDPETGEQGIVIWLSPSQSQQTTGVWFYMNNGRPGEGTFSLVDLTGENSESELESSFAAMAFLDNMTIQSTGGTLRLTSSSSTRVGGNFDFVATGFSVANPEGVEVTVEGSFNAITSGNIVFPF